jgi:hypothetical protein
MTPKPDATTEGVALAFGEWLSLHDVTVPDVLELAIGNAFTVWLDAHAEEIIAAIAEKVARGGAT